MGALPYFVKIPERWVGVGGGGGGLLSEIPSVVGGMDIFWSHTLPKFLIIIQLNIFSCN